ncbi:c-type cytochrome [Reyranella sp.]|uniref:c-type cytochrome n=1 Tax=Reyranella sp. TaxID=1929291 RepID=UPI00403565B7
MGRRLFATPRRDWRRIGFGSAMLVIVLTVIGFVLLGEGSVRIDPSDNNQVALGKRLYATACASCHGAALEGQPDWQRRLPNGRLPAPPHDASGHTWHHSDTFLMSVTQRGPAAYPKGYLTDMPAFRDSLSDREIAAILSYIKSEWPKDIRVRQNRLNSAR